MRFFRLITVLLFAATLAAQTHIPMNPKLYDPSVDARQEISEALTAAHKDHKRIILVFGGNWCFDCHVLDYRFHQEPIRQLVDANFHVIHVDVGEYNKNLDLAEKYEANLKKGVPTLSVLDSNGRVLFGMKNGEFEKARSLDPKEIVAFLNKWKAKR